MSRDLNEDQYWLGLLGSENSFSTTGAHTNTLLPIPICQYPEDHHNLESSFITQSSLSIIDNCGESNVNINRNERDTNTRSSILNINHHREISYEEKNKQQQQTAPENDFIIRNNDSCSSLSIPNNNFFGWIQNDGTPFYGNFRPHNLLSNHVSDHYQLPNELEIWNEDVIIITPPPPPPFPLETITITQEPMAATITIDDDSNPLYEYSLLFSSSFEEEKQDGWWVFTEDDESDNGCNNYSPPSSSSLHQHNNLLNKFLKSYKNNDENILSQDLPHAFKAEQLHNNALNVKAWGGCLRHLTALSAGPILAVASSLGGMIEFTARQAGGALVDITEGMVSAVSTVSEDSVIIRDVKGCAIESFLFAAERMRYMSEQYILAVTADDPETQYLQRIKHVHVGDDSDGGDWEGLLKLRCRFATLPWHRRQLIHETRHVVGGPLHVVQYDYSTHYIDVSNEDQDEDRTSDVFDRIYSAVSSTVSSTVNAVSSTGNTVSSTVSSEDASSNVMKCNPLDAALFKFLVQEAKADDEEAQYALTRWFVPPRFVESKHCAVCRKVFSVALFRHSCRNCGRSLCTTHSQKRRRILHYGINVPVRVCDPCARVIDSVVNVDLMAWKEARILSFLRSSLIPYQNPSVDRGIDKAYRVADYSLQIVKNTLILSYPAKIAVEALDILKRYGMSGLAGLLLRKDFVEAVETLKRISGMDKMFSMSLHELTACIYYKLAIDRGLRGCVPDEEHLSQREYADSPLSHTSGHSNGCIDLDEHMHSLHDNTTKDESQRKLSPCLLMGEDENLYENPRRRLQPEDAELEEALRFAPLSLTAVYEESAVECQRLASLQGWSLVYHFGMSAPEQPAYALFATGTGPAGRGNGSAGTSLRRREAVVAIRGTHSVHDIVTDIRAAPQEFPPPVEDIEYAMRGKDPLQKVDLSREQENISSCTEPIWEWLQVSGSDMSYACGGMARAALWLLSQIGPSLMSLHREGYEIIITGHSLGGGIAAMVTFLLQNYIPTVRCVTYGCPSCVDAKISDDLHYNVLNVVLHDDIISRVTPQSIRLLMRELMVFRTQVFRHLQQDWYDVLNRAGGLWSPKWREIFPNQNQIQNKSNLEEEYCEDNACLQTPRAGSSTDIYALDPIRSVVYSDDEGEEGGHGALGDDNDELGGDMSSSSMVMVEEDKLPELWLPGRVLHIYSHRGQYKAAIVGRQYPALRRIEVQGNIFADHMGQAIFDGLLEVKAVCKALLSPPPWVPYNASETCQCCENRFTWHSTFQGEAQEHREKHNCRHCGGLVCGPCSTKRCAIPKFGLIFPVRLCDFCSYRGDYAS